MFISRELKCKRCNHVQGHIVAREADSNEDYTGEVSCEHCDATDWERVFSVPVVRTAKLSASYLDGGIGRDDKKDLNNLKKAARLDKKAASLSKDSSEYKGLKAESRQLRKIKK